MKYEQKPYKKPAEPVKVRELPKEQPVKKKEKREPTPAELSPLNPGGVSSDWRPQKEEPKPEPEETDSRLNPGGVANPDN